MAEDKRGAVHLFLGRGRTGKSTGARFLHGNAVENGRRVVMVDADRTNATLASFIPDARRPLSADDETVNAFMADILTEAVESGGSFVIDVGGGDRLMLAMSERHDLPALLRESGIGLVLHHFGAGGRDDFETLRKAEAIGLTSDQTIITLNEGLAGTSARDRDPFEALLRGRTVTDCIARGAVVIRMPAIPLATMVAADSLFIGLHQAARGDVPRDQKGAAMPGAVPLGLFRRLELSRWLKVMEQRYEDAHIAEWLP